MMASSTIENATESSSPSSEERLILLPIDNSVHSERAFHYFINQVYRSGDSLIIVHVVEPVYISPAFATYMHHHVQSLDDSNRLLQDDIDKGKIVCNQYVNLAATAAIPVKAFLKVDTKPGRAILESAEGHGCSSIIMGNRGVGKLTRKFLGSVSEYVLHHTHIPVLIVPPEKACNNQ